VKTIAGRPAASSSWQLLAFAFALVPCAVTVIIALLYLQSFNDPASRYQPFTDAITYLGAGERLNAGHELYALTPGDRVVALEPQLSQSPLFSPPPIAVLWRPLAALPFGFAVWVVGAWLAVLGTMFYVGRNGGALGLALAFLLARAAGEDLAVANLECFFPLLILAAWKLRGRAGAGIAAAAMTAVKLTPGTLIGWLVGIRAWPALGAAALTGAMAIAISIVGAGWQAIPEYLRVASGIAPSESSLSATTGIPWLSPTVLVAGTIAAAAFGRYPRLSFAIAVIASVIGTPAFYTARLVPLLAIGAPLTDCSPRDDVA
jgi:hypothetical protein